jgi:hypothetical protein
MVIPLGSTSGAPVPTKRPNDSFEDPTVVANRSAPPRPSVPKSGTGMKVFKWIAGIMIMGVLLVVVAAAGVALAVYLAIIDTQQPVTNNPPKRPLVSSTPRLTPTPRRTPKTATPFPVQTDKRPTKRANFVVKANSDWQVSNIWTVGNENFRVVASGRYELEGIRRRVSASGISGHRERRVFKKFKTGALLMRTHYPDGKHSNIQAVSAGQYWQNYPKEEGNLEFMINDNSPESNSGRLKISFEMTDG